ncbi:MAG: hypothetical protein OXT07_06895 [bacterium]|nr:hypothetical protein [bacterium]
MEPVEHVAGVAEVGCDGGAVGGRPVGDDDFDLFAPFAALRGEKP